MHSRGSSPGASADSGCSSGELWGRNPGLTSSYEWRLQDVEDARVLYIQPAALTSMRATESPGWKVDNFRDDDDDRPAGQQIVADSFLSQTDWEETVLH